ncbi:C10 family peptidase [uncultured Mediterranea sp.]|uniref:C10 family peptidase n=1 Tax=uncultured Mediterranea sp. TaxID=1926662 RepID=UPI0028063C54|nr:C10 family peptidase [uncultured Mediterranea sp.]
MKRFLFLLILFLGGIASAENVTEDQARQLALSFWKSAPITRGGTPSLQLAFDSESIATRSSGLEPAYYVFDNAGGPGFVIVAGDDVAMPVLGYSFEYEFSKDNLPVNLKALLEYMRDEVNEARRSGAKTEAVVTRAWGNIVAGTPVVELKTAKWNQESPYNMLCPTINGQLTYTGCTATALAIVMRYHQWPEKGVGTLPGYQTYTYNVTVPDLPLGHTYDWENMSLKYPYSGYSQAEANAVATLMRDCGVMVQADYGPVGSFGTAASTYYIPDGLKTYMGYDKRARIISRNYYTTSEWNSLMQAELDSNRPVIYSGFNEEAGHAFVLDGYTDQNYYHVNWGWGGYCDGYFLLTALDPDGQGAGGSEGGYNMHQDAVIGIQKDTGEKGIEELRYAECTIGEHHVNGLFVDGPVVSGEPFELYIGALSNMGSETFVGDLMFGVADKEGKLVEELFVMQVPELPASYYYAFSKNITIATPVLPGYRIRSYYRSSNTPEWTVIRGNEEEGCTWDLLIADEYSIEETTQLTYNKKNRLLKLHLKDGVTVTLQSSDGNDLSDRCQIQENEVTVDTSLLGTGTYTLTLQKGDDKKTLNFSTSNAAE